MRHCLSVAVLALLVLANPVFAADPAYHLLNTYKIGGEGGWDYLTFDSTSGRLFVSHATHVVVLDADSGKTVGDIPDTTGVHGVALAPDLGRGFTSNGRENTVTVFDLASLKPLSKVKTGENPDAIVYDSSTKRVFTLNGRSHDATAIDAAEATVKGTIALGGKPEFAVSDGKGEIFVNLEDKSELLVLDPQKLEIKSRWPLAPCEEPTGLALDAKNRRLFSVCGNKLMAVVDADTGKIITTLPIGAGVDAARFDPETGLALASCGEGLLTLVKEQTPSKFEVAGNVPTQRGARTMELDSKTHRIFLATADFGPPPAASDQPRRPSILPDTFRVLVYGK